MRERGEGEGGGAGAHRAESVSAREQMGADDLEGGCNPRSCLASLNPFGAEAPEKDQSGRQGGGIVDHSDWQDLAERVRGFGEGVSSELSEMHEETCQGLFFTLTLRRRSVVKR